MQTQFAKDLLLATFTSSQFNARRFFESSQIEQDKFLGDLVHLAERFEEGDLQSPDQGPRFIGDEEADRSSAIHVALEQVLGVPPKEGSSDTFLHSLNGQGYIIIDAESD
ncbi:hypothetical protein CMI47_11275 [Candidatus Pacearchaeota archaeon]|nr:hypothetical protein [Candidatus Pacearchaeota archaeon]